LCYAQTCERSLGFCSVQKVINKDCLSVCLSVCVCVYVCLCLSVCLSEASSSLLQIPRREVVEALSANRLDASEQTSAASISPRNCSELLPPESLVRPEELGSRTASQTLDHSTMLERNHGWSRYQILKEKCMKKITSRHCFIFLSFLSWVSVAV
jgi:hypothetical protein